MVKGMAKRRKKKDLQDSKEPRVIEMGSFNLLPYCEIINQVRGHGKLL